MFLGSAFVSPATAHGQARSHSTLATGLGRVDDMLRGGFPEGQLVEISGAASSGKSTLAFAACTSTLAQGQTAAWVGPRGFWPLATLESDIPLSDLLVVHVSDASAALRASQLLLDCAGAVRVLVTELPGAFAPRDAQLIQLQRLAERSSTTLIFLTDRAADRPSLGAAVSLRLHVQRSSTHSDLSSNFTVAVLRNKWGMTEQIVEETSHGPDRMRICSAL